MLDLSRQFTNVSEKHPVTVICNLPTKLDDDGRVPADGMVKLPKGVTPVSSKESYGLMITNLLPLNGCFGIMAAALMASLMGNLASAANSISTLFAYDLWKRFRPQTPEHRMVIIGRAAAFTAFAVGIALVPLLDLYENIFASIQLVISHVCPPITGVFLMGIFWGKASARSAKLTMWVGSITGADLVCRNDAAQVAAGSRRLALGARVLLRHAVHADGVLHARRLHVAAIGSEFLPAETARRRPAAALLGEPLGRRCGRPAGPVWAIIASSRLSDRRHARPLLGLPLGCVTARKIDWSHRRRRVV